jgi:hypothetical protein
VVRPPQYAVTAPARSSAPKHTRGEKCKLEFEKALRAVRIVLVAGWMKGAIDQWTQMAAIGEGRVFRPVNTGDRVSGGPIRAQSVYNTVAAHAEQIGLRLPPTTLGARSRIWPARLTLPSSRFN